MPCADCPWKGGRGEVTSPERSVSSGILVLGEGPWRDEVAAGRCFVGPSGNELDKILRRGGLDRREVAVENAFACWKPDKTTQTEENHAVTACRGRVWEIIESVKPTGILLLGGKALRSVAPGLVTNASSDGLMRHRGSLWASTEINAANLSASSAWQLPPSVKFIMATIHPAALIRRARIEKFPAMAYRAIPSLDARRLHDALHRGRHLTPVSKRMDLLPMSVARKGFVFDLETEGEARTPCLLGVQALEGGDVYQAPWTEAVGWAREAFNLPAPKIGHNIGGFDLPIISEEGIPIAEPVTDTMTLGALCEPDMARALAYQIALYIGHQRPYYKETYREDATPIAKRALRAAWEHTGLLPPMFTEADWNEWANALDVDSTRILWTEMMERAEKEGWV